MLVKVPQEVETWRWPFKGEFGVKIESLVQVLGVDPRTSRPLDSTDPLALKYIQEEPAEPAKVEKVQVEAKKKSKNKAKTPATNSTKGKPKPKVPIPPLCFFVQSAKV